MSKLSQILKLTVLPIAIAVLLLWGCGKEEPPAEESTATAQAFYSGRHVRQGGYEAMPISGGNAASDTFSASTGSATEHDLTGAAITVATGTAATEKYVTIWADKDFVCLQSAAKGTASVGSAYAVVPKNTTVLLLVKVNFDYLQIRGLAATDTGTLYIWYHEFE